MIDAGGASGGQTPAASIVVPAISSPMDSRLTEGSTTPLIFPSNITAMRSPRASTSSSSRRDDQRAVAAIAVLDDLAVHVLDRSHVEAAGRLRSH